MKQLQLFAIGLFIMAPLCLHAQNVGIGEASPATKLDIQGDAGSDLLNIRNSGGTSRVYVQEDGNVGIGTATPADRLHVTGNITLGNNDRKIYWDWSNRAILQTDANGVSAGGKVIRFMNSMTAAQGNEDGGFEFTDQTGDVKMKITDNNVGIGTSTPEAKLNVHSVAKVQDGSNFIEIGSVPFFSSPGTATGDAIHGNPNIHLNSEGMISFNINADGSTNNNFQWHTGDEGSTTELMRLTQGGRLGVNTSSPDNRLHVVSNSATTGLNNAGDSRISAVFENNAGSRILIGTATNQASVINFGDTDAWNAGELYYDHNNDELRFRVNNGQRAVINSAGNLGIGVTSPDHQLHVNDKIFSGNENLSGTRPGWITFANTKGLFVNSGSDNAFFGLKNRSGSGGSGNLFNTVLYFGDDVSDDLVFETQDNGEIMRLTGTGDLGIGSSPGHKLDVVGDINTSSGYRVSGGAPSGQYLRGNGTRFVASSIQQGDLPDLGSEYIKNQTGLQSGANFNIDGEGRVGGNLYVSQNNTTGEGLVLADDGDIADMNNGFATMRFSDGVRINDAKRGGSPVIQLSNGTTSGTSSGVSEQHVFFNTGQNVGIGVTQPSEKLEVVGNVALDNYRIISGGGSSVGFGNSGIGNEDDDITIEVVGSGELEVEQGGANKISVGAGDVRLVKDGGNVGIGVTNPSQKLAIDGNIYLASTGQTRKILFAAETNDPGEIIHYENNNSGELWLSSSDDWDAGATNDFIIFGEQSSNTQRHWFRGDGSAYHQEDLEVGDKIAIRGGSPGKDKVLTSDANGDATWEDRNATVAHSKTTGTSFYNNSDIWRDVTSQTGSLDVESGDVVKIHAIFSTRLGDGSGNDDYDYRVYADGSNGCSDFHTNWMNYRPNEGSSDHDNFKTLSYLDYFTASCSGDYRFILQVRNTGNDGWQIRDRVLFVNRY